MSYYHDAQRLFFAASKRAPFWGTHWIGTSPEAVAHLRGNQLHRARHIIVDMGPHGLNELPPETVALLEHVVKARLT